LFTTRYFDAVATERCQPQRAERAAAGDLAAIRELADRLAGKPAQVIDRRDAAIEELSDDDLHIIASRGLSVPQKPKVLLIPPAPKVKAFSTKQVAWCNALIGFFRASR
jgi:hypothetical protein